MKFALRSTIAAAAMFALPLGAVLVAQPAAAQVRWARVADADQGRINNVSLNSDGGLRPGATLRVQVYATPGARWANVQLADSGVRVPLRERAPGEYVGTHVIRRGEHIDATGLMRVRAGWGEGPVAVAYNFPPSFQALAMGAGPAMVARAEVNSFAMWPRHDLDPGRQVHFRVEGTPHARAWVEVPEVGGVRLYETRPGVYVGRYTVQRDDDRDEFARARVILRSGNDRAVARLNDDDEHYGYGYGR